MPIDKEKQPKFALLVKARGIRYARQHMYIGNLEPIKRGITTFRPELYVFRHLDTEKDLFVDSKSNVYEREEDAEVE